VLRDGLSGHLGHHGVLGESQLRAPRPAPHGIERKIGLAESRSVWLLNALLVVISAHYHASTFCGPFHSRHQRRRKARAAKTQYLGSVEAPDREGAEAWRSRSLIWTRASAVGS
jgi:hypothetical protein